MFPVHTVQVGYIDCQHIVFPLRDIALQYHYHLNMSILLPHFLYYSDTHLNGSIPLANSVMNDDDE
jgi:hypothetical protein